MQQEAVTVPEAISTPEHGIEGHVQAQGVVESSFQKLRRSWMNLLASQLACSSVSRLGEQAWLLLSIAIDQGETTQHTMVAVASCIRALHVLRTFEQLMGQGKHATEATVQST